MIFNNQCPTATRLWGNLYLYHLRTCQGNLGLPFFYSGQKITAHFMWPNYSINWIDIRLAIVAKWN